MKKYLLLTYSLLRQLSLLIKESKIVAYTVLVFLLSFANVQNLIAQDSFENSLNGWVNIGGDQLNWTNDANGTPSNNTGPSSGSVGSYYMYIEASNENTSDKAWLEKTFDFKDRQNAQLTFDYHMYGIEMGTLNVLVNDNGTLTNVFSQSGNKGNTWNSSTTIDLSAFDGKQI